MKLFISLITFCNSGLLLLAQTSGQTGAGTAPAGQQPAQTVPAQTSPVQSTGSPSVGGTLNPNSGVLRPFGTVQGVTGGASGTITPTDDTGGTGGGEPVRGQTPAGVDILNPVLPPVTDSVPPTIQRGFPTRLPGDEISEPSGATNRPATPQGVDTSGRGAFPTRESQADIEDGIIAQQFQSVTGTDGTTQMAFPNENSVVTIVSRDGNLILQGTVSSERDRQNVERAIRQVSAGGFIDNQLQVVPVSNSNAD